MEYFLIILTILGFYFTVCELIAKRFFNAVIFSIITGVNIANFYTETFKVF